MLTVLTPPTGYSAPLNTDFSEYPKYVHFSDGRSSVIVHDADEEKAAQAGIVITSKSIEPSASAAPINNLTGPNDEEAMLRKIASDKGIHLDGRWKVARIRKAVEAASQ